MAGDSLENNLRVGLGQYDGCYTKNSSFFLGGILFSTGPNIYPDDQADLLVYSIADALLGAAALGGLFRYLKREKVQAADILKCIEREIYYRGYKIANIDVSISTLSREIENKLDEVHAQLISWLYLKSEQFNLKITPVMNTESAADFKIKITATALLENR